MKAMFRYRFLDNMKGAAVLLGVLTLLPVFFFVTFSILYGEGGSGSVMASGTYQFTGAIYSIVLGIVSVLADLRLGTQMGVGRKSVALAHELANLLAALVLAAAGTLLTLLAQVLTRGGDSYVTMDIFQMVYGPADVYIMPAGYQVLSMVFGFSLYWMASAFGAMVALAFYRLGRTGKWVLGVGMGLLFFVGLPNLLYRIRPWVGQFFHSLVTYPGMAIGTFLVFTAVFLAGAWLLARRTPVRGLGK